MDKAFFKSSDTLGMFPVLPAKLVKLEYLDTVHVGTELKLDHEPLVAKMKRGYHQTLMLVIILIEEHPS